MNHLFNSFANPEALWLIPVFFFFCLFDAYKVRILKLPLSSREVLSGATGGWKSRFEFLPSLVKFIGIVLLIVALARPQETNKHTEIKSDGVDIILTLDTSGSMKALDMKLSAKESDRLEVVKSVVRDFIRSREHDRMGMVVFGQQAFTQCPLTHDHDILLGYLDLLEIGMAGEGTAMGDGLAMSVKRMLGSKAKSRVIILLTDGDNNSGEVSPEIAAELAQKNGIKVYTIAVGSGDKLVPFPVKTPFGFTQRQMVKLDVNETLLKKIASLTGGAFFSANSMETLQAIYAKIDELEKTEISKTEFTEHEELFAAWLLPGLLLVVLAWLMRPLVFLRIP